MHPDDRTGESSRAPWIAFTVCALLAIAYWAVSVSTGRLFYYDDDVLRLMVLREVQANPGILFSEWGAAHWLHGPFLVQWVVARVAPRHDLVCYLALNLMAVLAATALLTALAYRIAGRDGWIAPVLFLGSAPVLWLSTSVMSEPLNMAALLGTILAGTLAAERASWRWLAAMIVLAWVATLMRFENWFVIPVVSAVAGFLFGRRMRWSIERCVLGGVTAGVLSLAAASTWAVASWMRHGHPFAALLNVAVWHSQWHEDVSWRRILGMHGRGLFLASLAAWPLLCAAVVYTWRRRGYSAINGRAAAAWLLLSCGVMTAAMHLLSVVGRSYGLPPERLILLWLLPLLPFAAVGFAAIPPRGRWLAATVAVGVTGSWLIVADSLRPNMREERGVAVAQWLEAANGESGRHRVPTLVLFPEGGAEFLLPSLNVFAPSAAPLPHAIKDWDDVTTVLEECDSSVRWAVASISYIWKRRLYAGWEIVYHSDHYMILRREE